MTGSRDCWEASHCRRWSLRVLTCPASCHQSCASPHLIINLWIHLNPTLDQSLFQVFYLNFHQSEASLVPPSRPYNLTSSVLKLWINLNVNFTFNQSASLFQVFYPNDPISTNQKPSSHKPPTRRVTWC